MVKTMVILVARARQQSMKALKQQRKRTTVAKDVGILFGSCKIAVMDVPGIKREAAQIVLKILNFKQKQQRISLRRS